MVIKLEDNKARAGGGFSSEVFNEKGCSRAEAADAKTFVIPGGICRNWITGGVPTVFHKSE